jgi:hypothetical protein
MEYLLALGMQQCQVYTLGNDFGERARTLLIGKINTLVFQARCVPLGTGICFFGCLDFFVRETFKIK